jgi:hypothetical protein
MLASPGTAIPEPAGEWVFEPKWDGSGPSSRSTRSWRRGWSPGPARCGPTPFPELADLGWVVGRPVVLDRETIVLGDDGRPSFERLSLRLHTRQRASPARGVPRQLRRQWLYTCDETMAAISTARAQAGTQADARPTHPASVALRRRLEAATDDNKRLRRRVTELQAQVAALYGELRARQNGAGR